MANQCTKFEVSSLSCSRDILGGLKIFLMGHMTWPRPFQGQFVACKLRLAMISPHTKCEVSMFTHYEDMKGNAKCRHWGGLVVRDHPRPPGVSPFDRGDMASYLTSIETMHLSCTIFEL